MKIQCPECRQRFDVNDNLMGKTVECGSCDHRFSVSDEVKVVPKKKFYPGEKRGVHLERFSNAKASPVASLPQATNVGFQQAHYQADVSLDQVGPPRPRKTIAAIMGVCLMVLVIIVFLLAGGKEGSMRDMETTNRFILVGFVAVLGCLLVWYGLGNNKIKAIFLCLVLGGGLLALPVVFPGNPTSMTVEKPLDVDSLGDVDSESPETSEKVGGISVLAYQPILGALEKHPRDSVVGIYIREAKKLVRDKIFSYLYEQTGKVNRGTFYDQVDNTREGLILLLNQTLSIDEIATMCDTFGTVNRVDREQRVIDVTVDDSKIVILDPKQSLDSQSPQFYRQQLAALKSFDPNIKMKAVKRLVGVEPKALRDDISKALSGMLAVSSNELQLEIIKALQVWSQPGDGAEPAVLQAVQMLHKDGVVSKPAMTFLVERKVEGAQVILMELWQENPAQWSDLFVGLGEGAQVLLLPALKSMDSVHIVAASDILGKCATKACLPHLEELMVDKDEMAKKSLKAAIDEIKSRP